MAGTHSLRGAACAAALALAVLGANVACGGSSESDAGLAAATAPDTDAEAKPSTLELSGAAGRVEVTIEVADSAAERRRGVSGRDVLAADHGMLFVNAEDVTAAFQMEDTTIPLSLAFIAGDGTILEIIDLEPCAAAPCPVYSPRSSYRAALEVNQGAFAKWEIVAGDLAVLPQAG